MQRIEVLYWDYHHLTGKKMLQKDEYVSWNHEGEYTIFYNDVSIDSVSFIIPTRNVCWIKVK